MSGDTAPRRTIAPDGVALWWFGLSGKCCAGDRLVLSAEELARSERFDKAAFAADYIRIRATMRRVLAAYAGTPPEDLVFTVGEHGKPGLACAAPAFNLTHTGGLAVIAIAGSGSVGVDAETLDAYFDLAGLSARVLTPREVERVGADTGRFLHHWVAKESYLKWLGSGLTVSPDTIELRADPAGRAVVSGVDGVDLPARYVHHFGLGTRYVGAVVGDRVPRRYPLRPAESASAAAPVRHRTSGVQT
ncbi:4'-phosphopantetheinyl transferase family protein [Nocardia sp. NPDC006044]|uniref:4'-phosphopantetheinyl transferase family protein n=1 Tax=Nocardia sp. NPDC006044 TaxID=3364306 RepID=UPI0036C9D7C0